jgi:hypothetical protein
VLARAAASRGTKAADAPRASASGGGATRAKDVVIESVEVDWGEAPARP